MSMQFSSFIDAYNQNEAFDPCGFAHRNLQAFPWYP
jgi:hypothetical protein